MINLSNYKNQDLLLKSFLIESDISVLSKAFDAIDLVKGRKPAGEGEKRNYKGTDYVKTNGKWIPEKKDKPLHEHAKETSEKHLKKTTSESKDPVLREEAHKEIQRRKKEESHEPKDKKKKSKPKSPPMKVIGKTQSGKSVGALSFWDENHKGFSKQDHLDAGALHSQAFTKVKTEAEKSVHATGRRVHNSKGK